MSTTRRTLLKQAAGAAVGASGLSLLARAHPASAALVPNPAWAYYPLNPVIQRFSESDPGEVVIHCSLMQVDNRISGALSKWYLWFWTHDTPVMRLYKAPASTGPWTYVGICNTPGPPGGYEAAHWSAGDVVWDPTTNYFFSCPHSRRPAPNEKLQDTFLIRSRDGFNWERVSDAPIIAHSPGNADGDQANYGRFLRDLDGNAAFYNGCAHIFYRCERLGPNPIIPTQIQSIYTLGGARSAGGLNTSSWTTVRGPNNYIMNPLAGAIFGIGSAIYASGRTYLYWSVAAGIEPITVYLKQSPGADPFAGWQNDGPGIPIYQHPSLVYDGPYVVADRSAGLQTMAYGSFLGPTGVKAGRWGVNLAVGPSVNL